MCCSALVFTWLTRCLYFEINSYHIFLMTPYATSSFPFSGRHRNTSWWRCGRLPGNQWCRGKQTIRSMFKKTKTLASIPIRSMYGIYGIFTYIWLICMVNVGKQKEHAILCDQPGFKKMGGEVYTYVFLNSAFFWSGGYQGIENVTGIEPQVMGRHQWWPETTRQHPKGKDRLPTTNF